MCIRDREVMMISTTIKNAKKIREYLEELLEYKRLGSGCDECQTDCKSEDKKNLERLIADFTKSGI